jgi:hypothetical protein
MASTVTKVRPIRIANETAEYFEGKPLNRIVESLHSLMERGDIEYDGELKIKQSNGVYTPEIEDMISMCSLSGLPYEEAMKEVHRLMEEGVLQLSSRGITVEKASWVERLEDVCHEKCLPIEKTVESVIKAIERGQI